MAKNRIRHLGRKLWMSVAAINGSGTGDLCKSGDPGVIGVLPVVVLTDEDANGDGSVDTMGVYNFTVTPTANIAEGAQLYWNNTAGTIGTTAAGNVEFGVLVQKGGMLLASGAALAEVRIGRA